MISRRGLLGGVGALLCAPAIVRAGNIMSVKPFPRGDMRFPRVIRIAFTSWDGPVTHCWHMEAGEQTFLGDLVAAKSDGKMYRVRGTADSDINVYRMGYRVG